MLNRLSGASFFLSRAVSSKKVLEISLKCVWLVVAAKCNEQVIKGLLRLFRFYQSTV
jgi:hypothetical protein